VVYSTARPVISNWVGIYGDLKDIRLRFQAAGLDGGNTIRVRVCLTEEMLGVVFAMEVASYGPLVGKTLLLHVIAICLRIGPNHPCLP